jgi:cytidylate kinase
VSEPLIITIDGPAGTGKSTVAAGLAKRLGLARLDTGAMYRTVALLSIREHIDPADGDALVAAIQRHELRCDLASDPPRMLLDGEDVEPAIRQADVGAIVSEVSVPPQVRQAMVDMQRATARAYPRLVSEGRDQGSVVFPEAQARFFLTADASERVKRRVRQLRARGVDVDEAAIAAEINHRDRIDGGRAVAPLVCPEGAIRLDTTGLRREEVIDVMEASVRALGSVG